MSATKVSVALIVLLVVASVCLASEDSTEPMPDPCSDVSDLDPARGHEPLPYYCQIVDDVDPIGQGQPSPDSSSGILQVIASAHAWLVSFGPLVPMIGT